jgi:hypothetical protein
MTRPPVPTLAHVMTMTVLAIAILIGVRLLAH